MKTLRSHLRSNVVGYIALFFSLSLGTAWAATTLPDNSVGTEQIRQGAVMKSDIHTDSVGQDEILTEGVGSVQIKDGSIRCVDFVSRNDICAPSGPGQPGTPGATGATGPTGPAGTGGGAITVTARKQTVALTDPTCQNFEAYNMRTDDYLWGRYCNYPEQKAVASCLSGEHATGGSSKSLSEGNLQSDEPQDGDTARSSNVSEDYPDPEEGQTTGWAVTADGASALYGGPISGPPPSGEPPAPEVEIHVVCLAATGPTGVTGATGATGPAGA